jgi:methionine-S-sulfoxide reductase
MKKEAYFAGGCFWCIEPVFEAMAGVEGAVSGYSGGAEKDPAYEDVKAQRTGHRETVCVTYDDAVVPYETLLDAYLRSVDPFDGGGQFIDRGHSYTLAVYYSSESERIAAEAKLSALEKEAGKRPCVSLEPFAAFYRAEEYHQDYYLKNPEGFRRELEESGRSGRLSPEGRELPEKQGEK